jgi:hypothetical protein
MEEVAMDMPLRSPSRFHRVLAEMNRSVPLLDLFYLSAFAETLALIDGENAGEPGSHDLDVDAIACVLRAWGDFEGDAWAGGFVLALCDGRRVYVESYADGDDWGPDSCASVVPMASDSDLPKLPSKHASELYGWTKDLPEVGEYLRRVDEGHRRGDHLARGV